MRILIADDHDVTRRGLRDLLRFVALVRYAARAHLVDA